MEIRAWSSTVLTVSSVTGRDRMPAAVAAQFHADVVPERLHQHLRFLQPAVALLGVALARQRGDG